MKTLIIALVVALLVVGGLLALKELAKPDLSDVFSGPTSQTLGPLFLLYNCQLTTDCG